jgi:hypothetical protein
MVKATTKAPAALRARIDELLLLVLAPRAVVTLLTAK